MGPRDDDRHCYWAAAAVCWTEPISSCELVGICGAGFIAGFGRTRMRGPNFTGHVEAGVLISLSPSEVGLQAKPDWHILPRIEVTTVIESSSKAFLKEDKAKHNNVRARGRKGTRSNLCSCLYVNIHYTPG